MEWEVSDVEDSYLKESAGELAFIQRDDTEQMLQLSPGHRPRETCVESTLKLIFRLGNRFLL